MIFNKKPIYILQLASILIIVLSILTISFYKFDILDSYSLREYDNYIHFIMYFLLGSISFISFKFKHFIRYSIVFLFCSFLAFLTEYFQPYFPGRAYDLKDLYWNFIGLLLGIIIIILIKYAKKIIN